MTRTFAALLVLALLPGCKGNKSGKEVALRNDYVDALCRVYQDDAQCVQNVQENCGGIITFDSGTSCQSFLDILLFNCPGYLDDLYNHKDVVQSCIAQLQGFDCSSQAWCDTSGTEFASTGDCQTVSQLIQAHCDTGTP